MRTVNLASEPFRNQALPRLLLGLAWLALAAATFQHALALRRLHSARASSLDQEVAALEAEGARLRSEAKALLRAPRPAPQLLAEWAVLKDLVDRRTFSWTALFSQLERVLPSDIRLVSIAPRVRKGSVGLDLVAAARSPQAGLDFMRILEEAEEFEDVYPPRVGQDERGGEFSYTMTYRGLLGRNQTASIAGRPR